jgi:chromosomal replication initiation ATPase DnaA
MISQRRREGQKAYKEYVERAIGEEGEGPFKNLYAGVILGSHAFIKQTLKRLTGELLDKEHIAHKKALKTMHTSDTIIDTLCVHGKITAEEVFGNNNHWRNTAIYLIKKFTGLPNRQIGELFGDLSYSAVAKAYYRFDVRLKQDASLRKVVEKCSRALS